MDAKILINGCLYATGNLEKVKSDKLYLERGGRLSWVATEDNCLCTCPTHGWRHPLTPVPDDDPTVLQLKLGKQVLESVPEKLRDRVTGYNLIHRGELFYSHSLEEAHGLGSYCSMSPLIALSPPAPEPKTDKDKTDLDLLRDVVEAYGASMASENLDTVEDVALDAALDAAEERVNE